MNDEGVIKFNCQWTKSAPLDEAWIRDLNVWRDKLYGLGLIGLNEDGIGYGNISIRFRKNQFIISGSGTGKFKKLTEEHYALVTDYDVRKKHNQLDRLHYSFLRIINACDDLRTCKRCSCGDACSSF